MHTSPIARLRTPFGSLAAAALVGGLLAATPAAAADPPVPQTDCTLVLTGQNCGTVTGDVTTTTPVIGGKRYIVHQWKSGTGTFTPNQQMDVEYLVVGGGGGSGAIGNNGGGGGGGGGQVQQNVGSPAATNGTSPVNVTVGAGGAGGTVTAGPTINRGSNGSSSSAAFGGGLGTITATGGGGGGSSSTTTGLAGANGGGGGGGVGGSTATATTGGASNTSPAGYAGGGGLNSNVIQWRAGGGGGGAGAIGGSAAYTTFSTSGNGGSGTASTLLDGTTSYYAGGGGGGVSNQNANNVAGDGGTGGGGAGSKGGAGTAGTANTGGGGGGPGGNNSTTRAGSSGGSGTVMIRYLAFTAPGSPTAVTATPGNAKARVSWTAPSNVGGASLTGYTVTAGPGGQTCSATAPSTTCDVSGLTNGTNYSFTVTATNGDAQTSSASTASSPVKVQYVPPAPTNPQATDTSFTWTAPPNYISTSSYVVMYRPKNSTGTWYVYAAKSSTKTDVWGAGLAPTSIELNATPGNCGAANITAGWTHCPLGKGVPTRGGFDFKVAATNETGVVSASATSPVLW